MNISNIHARPWCHLDDVSMGPATGVPSMLNDEETRFYFWLAREMAAIEGHIVDLGCFAGGSTAYLAEGNRQGWGQAQLFAYDNFRASEKVKERQLYPKGIAPFEGSNILPLSKKILSPWSPRITFRKGRIEEKNWDEGPIALLVLDASKTAETTDQMAEIFFPHLVPGQSLIVQQDELHWKEPWIAAQMQKLQAHFEPLYHVPGGMVAYRCIKAVDAHALNAARVSALSDQELIEALRQSKARLKAFNVAKKITRQIKAVKLNPGERSSWSFRNRAPYQ